MLLSDKHGFTCWTPHQTKLFASLCYQTPKWVCSHRFCVKEKLILWLYKRHPTWISYFSLCSLSGRMCHGSSSKKHWKMRMCDDTGCKWDYLTACRPLLGWGVTISNLSWCCKVIASFPLPYCWTERSFRRKIKIMVIRSWFIKAVIWSFCMNCAVADSSN